MRDEDYEAACDLACEMTRWDAAKYLRGEIGFTLMEAIQLTERLAAARPHTALAASVTAQPVTVG